MGTDRRTTAPHPIRRAGHARLPSDATVTWTVAAGLKGRRWRETVVRDGAIVHSLLLETFPDGRFAHLELSTPAGLLTLHPEGDGTLHGNAVTADGVRHVVGYPFDRDAIVAVDGSPVALAAAAWATGMGGRSGARIDAVVVRPDLTLGSASWSSAELAGAADADGLPTIDEMESWPLELEPVQRRVAEVR